MLVYRGEGAFDVWYKGEIHTIEVFEKGEKVPAFGLPGDDGLPVAIAEQPPISEWWVRLKASSGQIGWIRIGLDAQIDGRDGCAP
ncbi:MAG: hypothetical protein SGI90_03560 [Candidatus Eisenbacteria bacterium]|nr:hypothetical protein [Candidatus Eisenbacteria bacterium]